jgi:hypothetical protein
VRSTSVNHLNTRAIERYDDHISNDTMTTPYTGTMSTTGAPVTIMVGSAMPPKSAAMLITLATTSKAQAPQSTHGE